MRSTRWRTSGTRCSRDAYRPQPVRAWDSCTVSLYEFLLFVHVLAVAAWFGAALLSVVLMELAVRAQDIAWIMRFGEYDDTLAKVLFIPSALLVLITGVALVFEGPWSFTDDGWVLAGIVLLAGIFASASGRSCPPGRSSSPSAAREPRKLSSRTSSGSSAC